MMAAHRLLRIGGAAKFWGRPALEGRDRLILRGHMAIGAMSGAAALRAPLEGEKDRYPPLVRVVQRHLFEE